MMLSLPPSATILVAALLALLLLPEPTCAQLLPTCEPFIGQPSSCLPYIRDPSRVFVLPNSSQAQNVAPARYHSNLATMLPYTCRALLMKLVCGVPFPTCSPVAGIPFPIGRPPCRSICEEANIVCATNVDYYDGFSYDASYTPINCSATDPNTGYPLFPDGNFTVQPFGFVVPCDPMADLPRYYEPINCSYPIAYENATDQCVVVCPLPIYPKHQMDVLQTLSVVCGWITFIATSYTLIYFAMFPKYRQAPCLYIVMVIFCLWLLSISAIIPTFTTFANLWCDNENKPSSTSLCQFQGVLFMLGGVGAWWFWLISVINLVLVIAFELKLGTIRRLQLPMMAVGVGLDVLTATVPAAAGKITYTDGLTSCGPNVSANGAYQWAFLFLPAALCIAFIPLASIIIIFKLLQMAQLRATALKALQENIRLVIFLIFYTFVTAYIFFYRVYLQIDLLNPSGIERVSAAFEDCLGNNLPDASECSVSGPNFGANVALILLVNLSGLTASILFVATKEHLHFIYYSALALKRGDGFKRTFCNRKAAVIASHADSAQRRKSSSVSDSVGGSGGGSKISSKKTGSSTLPLSSSAPTADEDGTPMVTVAGSVEDDDSL